MKAIVFDHPGEPENVLVFRNISPPTPTAEQVLIRVSARPIQPADFLFIQGRYRIQPEFPQAAGLEGVGTIISCGAGVSSLEVGDRVAFRSKGTWAECAIAPTSRVYPVPPEIPDSVACQFSLNPLTAWGLLDECNLKVSSRILATAGRSVVARLLAHLAKQRGLTPTLLVRDKGRYSALNESYQVIANGANVAQTLEKVVNHHGEFHAALDPVGGSDIVALINALAPKSRLISYGILDDTDITLKASQILFRSVTWQGFGIDGWLDSLSKEKLSIAQEQLWNLLSASPELLPVADSFGLNDIQQAIVSAKKPAQSGKALFVD
ncbi:zinc-dependent alcohol dehydrogenase family protein [Desulfobulbus rhabdoformis]|uniref:zinc-dependent alcohol dehydrogenase family protein n=1 Tax=Desulfobulbus rhabdoformis TaxID=34032 RepID=UPI0019622909|nr:zinc-dependent alcohol dehydrogenase family protein [Desulfobulbus rhabdoformis]MBM9614524.1 zinc-dependent alcohol dehydrogenase family protein [Desulfobulbus rhabdoformis]